MILTGPGSLEASQDRGTLRGVAAAQARGGTARVLSLDLVERDRLDEAASFVVELLERPATEIRVLEGQMGLDEALVVAGHPDAFELEPVASVEPGTVWAVDGGSCTVADGRSFQVAAFRAARVRFQDGQTVDVERPQLDVRAVAPEEMARLARATLTELCGSEPERLPELPRPVDALREWAEWGAVGRTVREAAPGDLVLVDGSLHGGPLVPQQIVHRVHEEAVARAVSLAGVVKASTLYWGRNAPLVTLLKRRGDRELGPSRWRRGSRRIRCSGGCTSATSSSRTSPPRRRTRSGSTSRAGPPPRSRCSAGWPGSRTIRRSSATPTRSRARTRPPA